MSVVVSYHSAAVITTAFIFLSEIKSTCVSVRRSGKSSVKLVISEVTKSNLRRFHYEVDMDILHALVLMASFTKVDLQLSLVQDNLGTNAQMKSLVVMSQKSSNVHFENTS